MIPTRELKNIMVNPETKEIDVNAMALVQEAEERLHQPGHPSRMSEFLEGKTKMTPRKDWWPEEKKIETASLYAAGVVSAGDLARLTGVPKGTIEKWRYQDWWIELLERIHSSLDSDTVSKFTSIVDKALEAIQDRLINGDHIYDKRTGEIHRKPVSMRDATVVASTVVDKRQLLRGKPTSRSEKISVDVRLGKLAEEFAKFAATKTITQEPLEVVIEDQRSDS